MLRSIAILCISAAALACAAPNNSGSANPEAVFSKTVQPFLAGNCVGCHNAKVKTANLDLAQFNSVESVRANLKVWRKIAWKLELGDMPPAKSPQPKAAAKKAVIQWVNGELATASVVQK